MERLGHSISITCHGRNEGSRGMAHSERMHVVPDTSSGIYYANAVSRMAE